MDQILIAHIATVLAQKPRGWRRRKGKVKNFSKGASLRYSSYLCGLALVSVGCPLWKLGSLYSPLGHGNVSPAHCLRVGLGLG